MAKIAGGMGRRLVGLRRDARQEFDAAVPRRVGEDLEPKHRPATADRILDSHGRRTGNWRLRQLLRAITRVSPPTDSLAQTARAVSCGDAARGDRRAVDRYGPRGLQLYLHRWFEPAAVFASHRYRAGVSAEGLRRRSGDKATGAVPVAAVRRAELLDEVSL